MLRAVIFDFDGVIADSEALHLRAFNQVLTQFSIEISQQDYYKNYLGLSDFDLFKLLIDQRVFESDVTQIKEFINQKKVIYEKLAKTECEIIEGVRDFLQLLNDNNIPMAICSGALLPEIEMILEGAKLHSFFEAIVSAEQIEKGKPDPEGFLVTLAKLNEKNQNPIEPDECIVIEDSHWGLEAAKSAGMLTIAITNSYDADRLAMAEKIVSKLSELSIDDLQELCS
ncbi:MAG: HAD family phosphatase [Planctomycetes bacterium]|nr:HAD family phosphatase [Planctomycetota bacterium]